MSYELVASLDLSICSTALPNTYFGYFCDFIDENLIYLFPVAPLHILIGPIPVLVNSSKMLFLYSFKEELDDVLSKVRKLAT